VVAIMSTATKPYHFFLDIFLLLGIGYNWVGTAGQYPRNITSLQVVEICEYVRCNDANRPNEIVIRPGIGHPELQLLDCHRICVRRSALSY